MIDAALIQELRSIVGDQYVIWDSEDLLLYEYDGSIDRSSPSAVVLPGSAEELAGCVRAAYAKDAKIVPRGAGTGLSGGSVPLNDSVVIPVTRMNRVLDVDVENRVAIVEPGLVNIDLSDAVAKYGLYYAPDPSSQRACTIGGNVAENAGGPHCLALGVTTNHVLGVEVVLADGERVWLGGPTRDTIGYDLRGAFVSSEGTLGIATKIAVRLMTKPEAVVTFLAAFTSLDDASQSVSDIIAAGMVPSAIEMMDRVTIQACEPVYHPGYPEDAEAVLIVELDGLRETVDEQGELVRKICRTNNASEIREAEDEAMRAELWATRKGAIGAFGTIAPQLLSRRRCCAAHQAARRHAPGARDWRGVGSDYRQCIPCWRRQSASMHPLRRTRQGTGASGNRMRRTDTRRLRRSRRCLEWRTRHRH